MTEHTDNLPEPYKPPQGIDANWQPTAVIAQLLADLAAQPEETHESVANRALGRLYAPAVISVGQLAMYSDDDRVRLSAAQSIITANLQLKSISAKVDADPIGRFLKGIEDELHKQGDD